MKPELERNLGEQPLVKLLREHGLRAHDLVAASPGGITHKMVARAGKGRRLTPHSQSLVLEALNRVAPKVYTLPDLFNY
jgi:hypothetical protein